MTASQPSCLSRRPPKPSFPVTRLGKRSGRAVFHDEEHLPDHCFHIKYSHIQGKKSSPKNVIPVINILMVDKRVRRSHASAPATAHTVEALQGAVADN